MSNAAATPFTRREAHLNKASRESDAMSGAPGHDPTGRGRLVKNVLSSWGGHFVMIAAGFILPRMINDSLGQSRLGVWDFSWSFVAYFGLAQGGIVSSINRYVARHRASGDIQGINRVVSSVNCVLWIMSTVVMLLALSAAAIIPVFWHARLGGMESDAQWCVLLLSLGLALELGSAGFAGVITGCHRWDIHNAVYAATCVITTTLMVTSVLLGGGLPELALSYAVGETVGRMARVVLAYRVCPGLSARFSNADWATAREMLHFGGKSFVPQLGDLLLNQTISMLLLSSMGPTMLAIYTRPRSLVRNVFVLVSKLAYVIIPTASSLHAVRREDELRTLFIRSARYGVYVALPLILTIGTLADDILHVWMGPAYVNGLLLNILAFGSLASITQQPMVSILSGLNAHGRSGLANLAASIVAVIAAIICIAWLNLGLIAAALCVAIPLTIVNGLYVPWNACRELHLSFTRFLREVWLAPIVVCSPFAALLLASRWIFIDHPLVAILVGVAIAYPLLAVLYVRYVLPASMTSAILGKLGRKPRAVSSAQGDPSAAGEQRLGVCIVAHNSLGALTGDPSGRVGGVERQTAMTARWLAARGHSVSMLTWADGLDAPKLIDGVRVIPICRRDAGLPLLRFIYPRWFRLNRAMRLADADVYYQNCAEYVTGQVALWCRRHGRKFVYSVASDPDCDPRLPTLRTIRERVLYRFGLRNADAVIVQSRRQREMLQAGFDRESILIPMPCDFSVTSDTAQTNGASRRVLWVGRLLPLKRLEWLLDVAERSPDLHFDVVGPPDPDSNYTRELQRRASAMSNVTLHGRADPRRMTEFYDRALCLCCTSEYEGFPNTFLEAWSRGIPVVSTVDPDNLLRERGLGVAVSDVSGLSDAVHRLADDAELRRRIANDARRYFAEQHDARRVLPMFERVFISLARPAEPPTSEQNDEELAATPLNPTG